MSNPGIDLQARDKRLTELSYDCDRLTRELAYSFFSSRRRHTRCLSDWSSDVCSSDLPVARGQNLLEYPACHFVRQDGDGDRKSTRLNSSHLGISYAVFCLKKKNNIEGSIEGVKPNRDEQVTSQHHAPE